MQALMTQASFRDYISDTIGYFDSAIDIIPLYDYETLTAWQADHVLTAEYHYRDCDCAACYAAHFPCNDDTCDYCAAVYELKADGYTRKEQSRGIINYAEFQAWPNDYTWGNKDLLYSRCEICDILINGYHRDNFDGCCCEEHQDEYNAESDYEDEQEETSNESLEDRIEQETGFVIGQIMDESDYAYTTEAWINPNGNLHFVPCYNDYGIGHYETAQKLGFNSTDHMERKGYIHVSTYYSTQYPFHYVPNDPTIEQIETSLAFCKAHGWDLPEFVQTWLDDQNDTEISDTFTSMMESVKMQNLAPSWISMKRSERDRWYPLSGD